MVEREESKACDFDNFLEWAKPGWSRQTAVVVGIDPGTVSGVSLLAVDLDRLAKGAGNESVLLWTVRQYGMPMVSKRNKKRSGPDAGKIIEVGLDEVVRKRAIRKREIAERRRGRELSEKQRKLVSVKPPTFNDLLAAENRQARQIAKLFEYLEFCRSGGGEGKGKGGAWHVVIESFTLRTEDKRPETLSPVRMIGALSLSLSYGKKRPSFQQPSLAMSACTDARLKNWGFYEWGRGGKFAGKGHSRDSFRHGLTFVRRAGSNNELLKKLR